MSRYYKFFLEYCEEGTWFCVPPLVKDGTNGRYADSLFDIPYRSLIAGIFFKEGSLLEFNRGLPPFSPSAEVEARVNGDSSVWWSYIDQLMLDDWHDSFVLVTSNVEQKYASCFGNGMLAFPESCLKESGMNHEDLTLLQNYTSELSLQHAPINREHEFTHVSENKIVEVTWKVRVINAFDKVVVEAIKSYSDHYGSANLRFIVGWG